MYPQLPGHKGETMVRKLQDSNKICLTLILTSLILALEFWAKQKILQNVVPASL
jgi:hypothetical protein